VYSQAKTLTLYTMAIGTGSISFIASATITIMIIKHKDGLSNPFQRLVFGLSAMDVAQSLAMILSPFSLPRDVEGVLWSTGSTLTCEIQGFALHLGFAGVPMYMFSLTVYYLYAIKYGMSDREFSDTKEPYLHAASIIWSIIGGVACWFSGSFNMLQAGNVCWYTPFPFNCATNPDVECVRGANAFAFGWIFGGSNAITLSGIIYCLVAVCRTVINQEKKTSAQTFSPSVEEFSTRVTFELSETSGKALNEVTISAPMQQSFDYQSEKSVKRKKETVMQASLYVAAFVSTCFWAYIYGFLVTLGLDVPFFVTFLFSLFYPLGGLLNILVYTRPTINLLRKRNPGITWKRAFVKVVKAGARVQ